MRNRPFWLGWAKGTATAYAFATLILVMWLVRNPRDAWLWAAALVCFVCFFVSYIIALRWPAGGDDGAVGR